MRLILLAGLVLFCAIPAFAEEPAVTAPAPPSFRTDVMPDQGVVVQTVHVPEAWGDGAISERDGVALAEYLIWGFQQSMIMNGDTSTVLDRKSEDRMLLAWDHAWDHLDPALLGIISTMDRIWPAIRASYDTGDQFRREQIIGQFTEISNEVFGGLEGETVAYLIGDIAQPVYYGILDETAATGSLGTMQPDGTLVAGKIASPTMLGLITYVVPLPTPEPVIPPE
ncbi:MAG: hypothetical protein ABI743_04785 [bacterium]